MAFACNCGWAWITLNGKTIAWLDTHAHFERFSERYRGTHFHEAGASGDHPPVLVEDRGLNPVESGEFSRFDLHDACWTYFHSNVNESAGSPNPLVQSLAVLSARVGKNRLRRIASRDLHPLTQALLEFRLEAEAQSPQQAEKTVAS